MDANARQINSIDFNFLVQSQMCQYVDNQLQRTLHEQAVMEKTQTYVNEWVNALGNFDEAYRRESTKLQTKTIEQLDEER